MKRKLVLIDANSLVYRAFFALPTTLANSKGQVTNAAYGFTTMLIKLINDYKPDAIVAAFDKGKATFRHEEYEDYKAHRQPTPDDLRSQFPIVKQILAALNIPVMELEGFEADDILATLATQASKEHDDVYVVTGDRDAFQLVDDHVRIMTTKKGLSDIVIFDRDRVQEKYGVTPEQITDYLALKGDTSDNIPGVSGFGEKTASKLIQQFGSLENLLDNLESVENKRWRGMLEENIAEARMSKRLATMERDVPIDIDLEATKLDGWDRDRLRELFADLEFFSLLDRLLALEAGMGAGQEKAPEQLTDAVITKCVPINDASITVLREQLAVADAIAIAIRVSGESSIDQNINALAIALLQQGGTAGTGDETGPRIINIYSFAEAPQLTLDLGDAPASDSSSGLDCARIVSTIAGPLFGNGKPVITHDAKKLLLALANMGIEEPVIEFDTLLAAYLLHPERSDYPISELAAINCGIAWKAGDDAEALANEASATVRLAEKLAQDLRETGMDGLYNKIELPLVPVLVHLERTGVRIDTGYLSDLSKEIDIQLEGIENRIYAAAGQEFNINSPQQLGMILFEKLGLPKSKKTKTGYSTDAGVLAKLAPAYAICGEVLAFRELSKLKSTYIDALPKLINPRTGRVHTSFNQAVTTTGRLSSSNPNLQNIPVRTELGIRIRQAFIPANDEDVLLSADYSQIELRLLAHYSDEPVLLKAFLEGRDIHEATATEIFGAQPDEVTDQMRRVAKTVNFGVLYGMSAFGLSDRLGIPVSEAKQFIDTYFDRLPNVRKFIETTLTEATRKGYVETLLGRRRYIPELKSRNHQVRSLGERFAVNAPLQGTAADIIKIAMINIDRALRERRFATTMVLQVHDELIFELSPAETEPVTALVRDLMENAYPLKVKLQVEINSGNNWKQAK